MFLSSSSTAVPSAYGNGPTVALPMELLLHLHNCAPQGHEVRRCIKDYILAFGERNEKAHWSRGIVERENGDLHFDERIYDVALYRGKQETYIKTAEEAFEKLQSALKLVSVFQQDEFAAAKVLSSADIEGARLVPIRDLSEPAKKLQARSNELSVLVQRMKNGMAESLTHPELPQVTNNGEQPEN